MLKKITSIILAVVAFAVISPLVSSLLNTLFEQNTSDISFRNIEALGSIASLLMSMFLAKKIYRLLNVAEEKRKSIIDIDQDEVSDPADLERAIYIQNKSQIGMMIAKRLKNPRENFEEQYLSYTSVRDELVKKLDAIEDEFCRGFAAHQLIELCVAADDVSVARALLPSVRESFIREKILESCPSLKNE